MPETQNENPQQDENGGERDRTQKTGAMSPPPKKPKKS